VLTPLKPETEELLHKAGLHGTVKLILPGAPTFHDPAGPVFLPMAGADSGMLGADEYMAMVLRTWARAVVKSTAPAGGTELGCNLVIASPGQYGLCGKLALSALAGVGRSVAGMLAGELTGGEAAPYLGKSFSEAFALRHHDSVLRFVYPFLRLHAGQACARPLVHGILYGHDPYGLGEQLQAGLGRTVRSAPCYVSAVSQMCLTGGPPPRVYRGGTTVVVATPAGDAPTALFGRAPAWVETSPGEDGISFACFPGILPTGGEALGEADMAYLEAAYEGSALSEEGEVALAKAMDEAGLPQEPESFTRDERGPTQ
jgi:hypothetical protein